MQRLAFYNYTIKIKNKCAIHEYHFIKNVFNNWQPYFSLKGELMNKIILAVFAFSLLLFGCIDLGGEVKNETNVTAPPPPAPTPVFTVASPINGATIMATGDSTNVDIVLSSANLEIKKSGTNKVGEGHFKVSLDGGAYVNFYSKTYTLSDVSVGNHTIVIELVHNDDSSYSPVNSKTVTFEVKKSTPAEYVPKDYTVEIRDFDYNPEDITVKVGDRITWMNTGSFPRSATCFIEGSEVFDTGVIAPGSSFTIEFGEGMSCEYYSVTYMAMKGQVVVEPNTTG
jgi:plastocyanin